MSLYDRGVSEKLGKGKEVDTVPLVCAQEPQNICGSSNDTHAELLIDSYYYTLRLVFLYLTSLYYGNIVTTK